VEQLLDQTELVVPADKRRLQAIDPLRATDVGDDRSGGVEPDGLRLALQQVLAGIRVRHRRRRQRPRRLVDPHLPGLRDGLDPSCGVHRITRDHPLADGAQGDRHLTREDADPHRQVGDAGGGSHASHPVDQVQASPHGALSVVLVRYRHTPDRHDRVTDELLDRAAVPAHHDLRHREVVRQKLAHVLRVARLRQGGEPHEIAEEHRGQPSLGDRLRRLLSGARRIGSGGRTATGHRRAAITAEPLADVDRRATARAYKRERPTAVTAEPLALRVLRCTRRARHRHRLHPPSPVRQSVRRFSPPEDQNGRRAPRTFGRPFR
jgi:hypothetical protein